MIQHPHQLFTFCPWCIFVEEVKLGNALTEKVAQHNACFLISLTLLPDFVQTHHSGINDVAAILRRRKQFYRCAVAVIGFIQRKGGGFYERRDKLAILVLAAQFFRTAGRIAADRLPHLLVFCDAFAE